MSQCVILVIKKNGDGSVPIGVVDIIDALGGCPFAVFYSS